MDLPLIKKEEPVDYFLILPIEEEKNFELSATIKEEPNDWWTGNEPEDSKTSGFKPESNSPNAEDFNKDKVTARSKRQQSKNIGMSSNPFPFWKVKPPGPEQRELERMFNCNEIDVLATADSVRKTNDLFRKYSLSVFSTHFRRTKAHLGISAVVKGDAELSAILESDPLNCTELQSSPLQHFLKIEAKSEAKSSSGRFSMNKKKKSKGIKTSSHPFRMWKENPPGPEQCELERMFNCNEIDVLATPNSVRKTNQMFSIFSAKVFAAHFRKTKARQMNKKKKSKGIKMSSHPLPMWKESPPGPEQSELERMFNCKEIDVLATPNSVRMTNQMFMKFSANVFSAHFRKTKDRLGLSAVVEDDDAGTCTILELGSLNSTTTQSLSPQNAMEHKVKSSLENFSDPNARAFLKLANTYTKSSFARSEAKAFIRFKSFFGITPLVCSIVWDKIKDDAPAGSDPKHLLWCLNFLKQYSKEYTRSMILGVDEKTNRKWTWIFVTLLSNLNVVSKIRAKISSNSKHKCDKCSCAFKKVHNLIRHRAKHSQLNLEQCKICKRFYSKARMVLHAVGHNGPPFQCTLCSKRYTCRSSWNFHVIMHDGVSYDCDICKKRFSQKGSLVAHMTVHFDRKKDYKCEKCHATFFRKTHLNRHMRNLHSNTARPQFRCSICNKVFTRKDTLKDHRCSNGASEKPTHWICETCGKKFSKKYYHSLHVSRNCDDGPMIECDICSKLFRRKSGILKHFASRYHSNSVSCPERNQTFSREQQVKYHLRGKCHVHTDIKI